MKSRKSAAQVLIAVEVLALVVVVIFGVVQKGKATVQEEKTSQINSQVVSESENTQEEMEQETETQMQQVAPVVFSEQVNAKLSSMTLEEKVAQMFMITPESLTGTDAVNVAGNATKEAINTYPVGGLVYSKINFQGKEQTKKLLSKTQEYHTERMGVPMFLAVEEVGGKDHSPIATKDRYDVEKAPASITDGEEAKKTAGNISEYLKETGITMNILPFGTLSEEETSFGVDASNVSVLASESVATYKENKITTAVGVFPGTATKSLAEWKESDALVFKATINAGNECMVVGNILYKDLTESEATICSMSENVVQYIRGDMGFDGILITDSLSQEVVTRNYSSKEAAVNAINAGMNMLYCPQNFEEAYQGVIESVNNGDIKMETIDQSVGRILTAKMSAETQE